VASGSGAARPFLAQRRASHRAPPRWAAVTRHATNPTPLPATTSGLTVAELLALPIGTRIYGNPPNWVEGGVFGTVTGRDGGGDLITWDDGQVCGVWPDDDDHAEFAGGA